MARAFTAVMGGVGSGMLVYLTIGALGFDGSYRPNWFLAVLLGLVIAGSIWERTAAQPGTSDARASDLGGPRRPSYGGEPVEEHRSAPAAEGQPDVGSPFSASD